MLSSKQTIKSRSPCKDCSDKKTDKTKNKKIDLGIIEEAANRFAELLISQIEFNKDKIKNHSVEDSELK